MPMPMPTTGWCAKQLENGMEQSLVFVGMTEVNVVKNVEVIRIDAYSDLLVGGENGAFSSSEDGLSVCLNVVSHLVEVHGLGGLFGGFSCLYSMVRHMM